MRDFLRGPVGVRYRTQNVANWSADQAIVLDLLTKVKREDGGKRGVWPATPLAGPDRSCPGHLVDAIWDFQHFWKARGAFAIADGVVDPHGNSIRRLLLLADRDYPVDPTPPDDDSKGRNGVIGQPRIPGAWQITNIWSTNVGEVGQAGRAELEITAPDNKKFVMTGWGAGFGVSVDPVGWWKAFRVGSKALDPTFEAAEVAIKPLLEMLGKNVGFSIGDYLQKLGVPLTSVTGGRIIPNPIFNALGQPKQLSRTLITGGFAKSPFMICSVGGGVGAGMEGGVAFFGSGGLGLFADAIGVYGTSGVTLKFGAGLGSILYLLTSVDDKA